jgi:O-antigen ligase
VLGAAPAIRFATARDLRRGWRVAALVALVVLLTCLGLTYSRGGILALVVTIVVLVAAGGPRLPSVGALGLGGLGAAPALAFAWTDDRLTANQRPLADQIDAGLVLGGLLLAGAALAALAGLALLRAERRVAWPPRRSRTVWLVLAVVALALLAGGVTAAAMSERGLRGTVEEAADAFTEEERRDPTFEPGRLLDGGSANRWSWWREAGGAWADEPVRGWGAGSFETSRRLYRVSAGDVRQPHSAPMQLLAENGLVGALLGLGAVALLLGAAVGRVRRTPGGSERDLAAALLAGAAAWAAHALVDWDLDIPAVTVPALVFLGVLGARPPGPAEPAVTGPAEPRPGRALALAAACLAGCLVLASALVPALSDAEADRAYRGAAQRDAEALEGAAADAELAARLNPLAVRPLFAAAAVAEGRGRVLEARGHLLDAVERQPWSVEAWTRLARIAIRLADREGAQRAAARALALDPGDPATAAFARRAHGIVAPAETSATATATPLPAAPGAVPGVTPLDPAPTTTTPGPAGTTPPAPPAPAPPATTPTAPPPR